jgi:hypothetical protein
MPRGDKAAILPAISRGRMSDLPKRPRRAVVNIADERAPAETAAGAFLSGS